MSDIEWSACYCPVCDECHVRSAETRKTEPVEECMVPTVAFKPSVRGEKWKRKTEDERKRAGP